MDDTDAQLEQQIAIWYQRDKKHKIKKKAHQLASTNDLQHQIVSADLHHFSQYAVSW